jgi:hypothetical protein
VCIYNDVYRPIFGARHPWALGKPAAMAWDVVWAKLGPLLHDVVATGDAFAAKDLELFLDRSGFIRSRPAQRQVGRERREDARGQ